MNALPYSISEAEFMQFLEVENHDDFYTFENGSVSVRDQAGQLIMYNVAKERLKELEDELLAIGTFFIEKEAKKRNKVWHAHS